MTANINQELQVNKSVDLETTQSEADESDESGTSCTYWVRDDDRDFLTDPNGEIVNLARLTAYARYGDEIHGAHVHHEIPLYKIDAPAFLSPLSPEEHGRLHGQESDPVEIEGIPRLRADE